MLSFKLASENLTIEIDCDDAGIDLLVSRLLSLKGTGSHIHLRAEHGPKSDLSPVTPFGEPAITEVILSHGGD